MYILRLFEHDTRGHPIDARLLREGTLTIGRDPAADWVMHDPESRISRSHCVIEVDEDVGAGGRAVRVRALGTNGVFDDLTGERLPQDLPTVIAIPSTLRFGNFRLVVALAAQAGTSDNLESQTLILTPPLGLSADVPGDYADVGEPSRAGPGGSLLDCFCEGAGLEPSAFALEDPQDIMRRAGAVYRQMVLGVGDLMGQREATRRQYQLARTTIGGADNNPFKWAPTQRLALDLLLAESHGFMSGPAALKASFKDIKRHLIATFSGLHASLRAAVGAFDPEAVDDETRGRGSLLQSRDTQFRREIARRHADYARQVDAGEDGTLNQVFVKAYEDAATTMEDNRA